jgi:large subunit ribosomal protein L13e
MVKHNNVIPNLHFHKQWARRVKTWFDQPGQKKARRLARQAKAAAIAPRPVAGLLRPAVHCQTQKYNHRVRAGRGFTLQELKAAGVSAKQARTIGIAVDHRRSNKSVESLEANVARLQEYMSKLVVFPRGSKVKAGDASKAEARAVPQLKGDILPISAKKQVEFVKITDEMKAQRAYHVLRLEHNNAKMQGKREKRARDEEEAKK